MWRNSTIYEGDPSLDHFDRGDEESKQNRLAFQIMLVRPWLLIKQLELNDHKLCHLSLIPTLCGFTWDKVFISCSAILLLLDRLKATFDGGFFSLFMYFYKFLFLTFSKKKKKRKEENSLPLFYARFSNLFLFPCKTKPLKE